MTQNDLDPEFIKILACPACDERPPLGWNAETSRLICDRCGRRYPVKEGIPILLVEEAELADKKS